MTYKICFIESFVFFVMAGAVLELLPRNFLTGPLMLTMMVYTIIKFILGIVLYINHLQSLEEFNND